MSNSIPAFNPNSTNFLNQANQSSSSSSSMQSLINQIFHVQSIHDSNDDEMPPLIAPSGQVLVRNSKDFSQEKFSANIPSSELLASEIFDTVLKKRAISSSENLSKKARVGKGDNLQSSLVSQIEPSTEHTPTLTSLSSYEFGNRMSMLIHVASNQLAPRAPILTNLGSRDSSSGMSMLIPVQMPASSSSSLAEASLNVASNQLAPRAPILTNLGSRESSSGMSMLIPVQMPASSSSSLVEASLNVASNQLAPRAPILTNLGSRESSSGMSMLIPVQMPASSSSSLAETSLNVASNHLATHTPILTNLGSQESRSGMSVLIPVQALASSSSSSTMASLNNAYDITQTWTEEENNKLKQDWHKINQMQITPMAKWGKLYILWNKSSNSMRKNGRTKRYSVDLKSQMKKLGLNPDFTNPIQSSSSLSTVVASLNNAFDITQIWTEEENNKLKQDWHEINQMQITSMAKWGRLYDRWNSSPKDAVKNGRTKRYSEDLKSQMKKLDLNPDFTDS